MSRFLLKDNMGRIIGDISEQSNGNKILKDANGKILGTYCAMTNLTKDSCGRLVGRGDLLAMLLKR